MKERLTNIGIIRGLRLANFKCHEETREIEFAPLTLLVGPNSSGKTAFLQPLLVLKQTLEPGTTTVKPIILNGGYVELGGYNDIIYNHEIFRDLEITLKLGIPIRKLRASPTIKEQIAKELGLKEINIHCSLEISFSERQRRMVLSTLKIHSEVFRLDFDLVRSFLEAEILGQKLGKLKETHPRERSLRGLMTTIPLLIRRPFLRKERQVVEKRMWQIYYFVRRIVESITSSIESLQYIGPVREYPSRYYLSSGEKVSDVGTAGENAIQLVHQDKILEGDLTKQLKRWLKKLEVAEGVDIKQIDPNLFSLEILSPLTNTSVNITDTGFGVSQIIPIIVQSNITPSNSTLILEQPEIHLHPKAQATLADLLVQLVKKEKRFIVETHSEHIILRLQRRVAEGEIEADKIRIYYFDITEAGVTIRPIGIDTKGQLLDFPKGFMEEGLDEAYRIALASSSE